MSVWGGRAEWAAVAGRRPTERLPPGSRGRSKPASGAENKSGVKKKKKWRE